MNEKINPEDAAIIEALENAAQGIKPNIVFEHELEKRLTAERTTTPRGRRPTIPTSLFTIRQFHSYTAATQCSSI